MKRNDLMGSIIAALLLSCMLMFSLNTFFVKTTIAAKILAAGGFIILLF